MSHRTFRLKEGARVSVFTLLIAFGSAALSTVVALPVPDGRRAIITILSSSLIFAASSLLGVRPRDAVTSLVLAAGLGIGIVMITPLHLTPGLIAVVFAAASEEVLYRGYCFTRLNRIVGTPVAIVISSFLFAMMHFNPDQFLRLSILAGFLALLYRVTENLPVAAAAHLTYNLLILTR